VLPGVCVPATAKAGEKKICQGRLKGYRHYHVHAKNYSRDFLSKILVFLPLALTST
jgi:hypothetical protein